jgi:C4-type Zn-finger protein
MKVNDIPMVPLAALERAQGELKSAYVQIADLHADIEESCQTIDQLRLDNGLLEQANDALQKEVEMRRTEKFNLVAEVARIRETNQKLEVKKLNLLAEITLLESKVNKGAKKA